MEEGKSENTGSWRPKFQSEFSMGEYDFARYNKTLINIDSLSGMVNSTAIPSLELMQKFLSELINLFDNFRPLISVPTKVTEFDNLVEKCATLKRRWESSKRTSSPFSKKLIFQFVDGCKELKTKLYSIKQVIGLGIVVKRNMTTAERIKKGIRGNSSLDNLPTA